MAGPRCLCLGLTEQRRAAGNLERVRDAGGGHLEAVGISVALGAAYRSACLDATVVKQGLAGQIGRLETGQVTSLRRQPFRSVQRGPGEIVSVAAIWLSGLFVTRVNIAASM
jgi:hypothetical protein